MNLLKEFFKVITAFGSLVSMGVFGLFFLFTNSPIFIKLFLGIAISFIIVYGIRLMYFRLRPTETEKPKSLLDRMSKSSFPSAHASQSTTFALIVGFATNTTVLLFLICAALVIIYSRYYLKKHYITDLLAGTIIGIIIGLVITALF